MVETEVEHAAERSASPHAGQTDSMLLQKPNGVAGLLLQNAIGIAHVDVEPR